MTEEQLEGRILYGINNIYTVEVDGRRLSCRIRGKVLRSSRGRRERAEYNPLAVGDRVRITPDPHSEEKGWIRERLERSTWLTRYNKNRRAPQVLAANVDLLVCVASAGQPPFRPRFLDRMLVSAHAGRVEPTIFVNKSDLGVGPDVPSRPEAYRSCGYTVLIGSALEERGLEELRALLHGKTVAFVGQSGVGKSLLLNRLDPELDLKVGEISEKYNRGGHTTNFAAMVNIDPDTRVIDTPGIRELDLYGLEPEELGHYFPEFDAPAADCGFSSCRHLDEPGCAVKEAVSRGGIHPDRYESYVRMYLHLEELREQQHG